MKMIEHNHFICHLILGTFTEYPFLIISSYPVFMFCNTKLQVLEIRCYVI